MGQPLGPAPEALGARAVRQASAAWAAGAMRRLLLGRRRPRMRG
jgi:hypothetical protein